MKKLYYLDESEKDRILHLHESRTKDQYLLTEQKDTPSRSEFNNLVRTNCSSKKFVEPSATLFNYFWKNFSRRNRMAYFDDPSLDVLKTELEKLTFDKFCSLNKKYVDGGGYSANEPTGDLIYGMSKFIYADSRWNPKVKEPLQKLMNTQGDVIAQGQNDTLESVPKEIKTYCSAAKGGTVNDAAYKWFKFATSGYGSMSTDTYNNVLSSIKTLSSLDFCATYRKYKTEIGKDLIDSFLARIVLPFYKQEIITSISSMIKNPKTATGVTAGGGGGGV